MVAHGARKIEKSSNVWVTSETLGYDFRKREKVASPNVNTEKRESARAIQTRYAKEKEVAWIDVRKIERQRARGQDRFSNERETTKAILRDVLWASLWTKAYRYEFKSFETRKEFTKIELELWFEAKGSTKGATLVMHVRRGTKGVTLILMCKRKGAHKWRIHRGPLGFPKIH